MELEAALRDQVGKAIGRPVPQAPIKKLKGDASNRSYYRVGTAPESWVVMVMPPEASKKSEEASKGEPPKELPFVNVHRYLEKLGVRVPRILRFDEPAGMMVLEDLSDVTFEAALEGGKNNHALYTRAVDLLARLRAQAERQPEADCLAFTRPWGFEVSAVTTRTSIWYGTADVLASQDHHEHLLSRIPRAERHELQGGHVLNADQLSAIYEWLGSLDR